MGAAAGDWWKWNITVCIHTMMYLGLRVQKEVPTWGGGGGGHKVLMAYTMRARER